MSRQKSFAWVVTFLVLTIVSCSSKADQPSDTESTPAPNANDYDRAGQQVTYQSIVEVCKEYLEPLGNPGFNGSVYWIDETQNPGTIQVDIYPAFSVPGMANTTIRFGPGGPKAYKIVGLRTYTLTGNLLNTAVKSTLKANDGTIGYLAQFEVSFGFQGNPTITPITCQRLKETNQ